MRRGYTLVEVLIALVLFSILTVPCVYLLVQTSKANGLARTRDDALQLARESVGELRLLPAVKLSDSTWTRTLGAGRSYQMLLQVQPAWQDSSPSLGSMQLLSALLDTTRQEKRPIELELCVSKSQTPTDTIACWHWLRPVTEVQW